MFIRFFLMIIFVPLLISCASINSSAVTDDDSRGGLNYYLPKQNLIVNVTVSDPVIDQLTASRNAYTAQAKSFALKVESETDPIEKKKYQAAVIEFQGLAGKKQTAIDKRLEQIKAGAVLPQITSTKVSVSEVYPDLDKQFSLNYSKNLVGKNKLDIGVSKRGLLTSANSKTESQLAQVLSNLAKSVGSVSGFRTLADTPEDTSKPCSTIGTYVFNLSLGEGFEEMLVCNKKVLISLENKANEMITSNIPENVSNEKQHAGIFYRQNIPYIVTIGLAENGLETKTLLFATDATAVHFLPIHKTAFANNEATFAFVNGIPTSYIQESDGELVALLKIPADVISAYFGAVGSIFSNFSDRDKAQSTAFKQSVELELTKQKSESCLAAIKAGNNGLISSLKCAEE